MVPVSREIRLPMTMSRLWSNDTSHTRSVPVTAGATRLPATPTTSATSIDVTPTRTEATTFATITRRRLGTWVKVVRPVRWLHSEVMARIAMIGRMTVIGNPIALANV